MTSADSAMILNQLGALAAPMALSRCCGARNWVSGMMAETPYESMADLEQKAEEVWWALQPDDWLEAFLHHPQIGADPEELRKKFAATSSWSSNEQAGVQQADETVIQALASGNKAYLERFGFIFIVCATGKSAAEMLSLLEARLPNDRETELQIAAGEQNKITLIRLRKLSQH